MFEIILSNTDRRYSPENAASPLFGKIAPFRPVRVQSFDGTTTRTHWTGWIETLEPDPNSRGERRIKITAAGAMQFLQSAETNLPLQENQRTDEIISKLLTEVVFPPSLTQAWVLGVSTFSELDQSSYLPNTSTISIMDEGVETLAYAGDNWVQGEGSYDVYRAIDDLTSAERGRFFFNREGKAIFWNRLRLQDNIATSATFADTMQDLAYQYASPDDLKNEIVVVCHPRTVSPNEADVLWTLEKEITIAPGKEQKVSVKYGDAEAGNVRIGAKDVQLSNVVFSKGTGGVVLEAKANSATLKITNGSTGSAVLKTATVVGRKITDYGRMEAQALDLVSASLYGRRQMRLNLPSVDNLEYAESIADYELARRKDPQGTVKSITLRSHATKGTGHHAQQLARTIGEVVQLSETQTAHSNKRYVIIGEAHRLSDGGQLLETTWYLEPMPTSYPWKLGTTGRGELDAVTQLGF
jgi:hypothetical protein